MDLMTIMYNKLIFLSLFILTRLSQPALSTVAPTLSSFTWFTQCKTFRNNRKVDLRSCIADIEIEQREWKKIRVTLDNHKQIVFTKLNNDYIGSALWDKKVVEYYFIPTTDHTKGDLCFLDDRTFICLGEFND